MAAFSFSKSRGPSYLSDKSAIPPDPTDNHTSELGFVPTTSEEPPPTYGDVIRQDQLNPPPRPTPILCCCCIRYDIPPLSLPEIGSSRQPVRTFCPVCKNQIATKVIEVQSTFGTVLAFLFLALCLCPCAMLVLILRQCKDSRHYCPYCFRQELGRVQRNRCKMYPMPVPRETTNQPRFGLDYRSSSGV